MKDSEDVMTQWLLRNKKICLCKGIPHKRFLEAIEAGARSLQEINNILGSGSGDCNGERCGQKIKKLLCENHSANNK